MKEKLLKENLEIRKLAESEHREISREEKEVIFNNIAQIKQIEAWEEYASKWQ